MPRRLVARISPVGIRAQKAVADRGRGGLGHLRRSQACPPAGHSRQDAAGRSWVPRHLVLQRGRGQRPLRRAAEVQRTRLLEGTAVVAYRIRERRCLARRILDRRILDRPILAYQIWEGQTWARRIWLVWARWAGHPAQEDHSVFLRYAPEQSGKEPANDWPHKWMEAWAYHPECALEDGRESIVSGWGPRARARREGRAVGTGSHGGRRRAEDGERSWTSSRGAPTALVVRVFRFPTMLRVWYSAALRHECPVALCHGTPASLRSEYPGVRRPVARRAALRCARARKMAADPLRGEACLRQAYPDLFRPSALHLPAASRLVSTTAGRVSPVWLVASTRHWLLAGRPQAWAAKSVRVLIRVLLRSLVRSGAGGRWERTLQGARLLRPRGSLPGPFLA
jgi:hypothetical protein